MKVIILLVLFWGSTTVCLMGQVKYDGAVDSLSPYKKAKIACDKKGYLEGQECMEGVPLPNFEGYTYDGKKISWDSLKGKVVVLNFWFLICPPCIAELDGLNDIVAKYSTRKDIAFISFTRETQKTLATDFFPNYTFGFEIIPNAEAIEWDIFQMSWGYPTTIVVDKSGKIYKILSGGTSDKISASADIKMELTSLIEACLE